MPKPKSGFAVAMFDDAMSEGVVEAEELMPLMSRVEAMVVAVDWESCVAEVFANHLSLCDGKLGMQDVDLALKGGDGSNTTIDRVANPCICLVHQAAYSIALLFHWDLLQPFSPTKYV